VISAIGAHGRGPTAVCSEITEAIITAQRDTGGRRLVVMSAAGAHTTGDGLLVRLLMKPVLQQVLRHPFTDMLAMERLVRTSGLDWTIVCPPRLTNGRRTGAVRSRLDAGVRGGFSLSRADLADATLRIAADPALAGHSVFIAHA
jgi:putative NADH-flavin reductase